MTIGYQFPVDVTLDEVRAIVKDNPNFVIVDKKDYIVVNYVRAGNDTFPPVTDRNTAIMRELRGLIFSPEGNIIARRFHKFFNYGEREDLLNINTKKAHRFLEKLDGSMITPIPLPGGFIRWGTKMGLTEVGMQAEEFVAKNKKYEEFAAECVILNVTPIFEWCSRKQRIVVDYPEDKLVLLAVRCNFTGNYYSFQSLKMFGQSYNIPIVADVVSYEETTFEEKIKFIRNWEDAEGVVIRFDDGHMVKIKADSYVSLHRAKSLLDNERDVVGLVLSDKQDDLYPLLSESDKQRLSEFSENIWIDINRFLCHVNEVLEEWKDKTRKDFALESDTDATTRSFVFSSWGKPSCPLDSVVEYIQKHLGSASQYEKCHNIIKTRWKETNE